MCAGLSRLVTVAFGLRPPSADQAPRIARDAFPSKPDPNKWGAFYALAALLAISACATTPVAVCPPLRTYTPEFNQRLASELDPLPADSAIVQAIQDYIGLRDAIRECRK